MQEHYEIETLEQLRAISDMLRIRIVDLLTERPMTVTQLAELLQLAPAKVHYHVRELEKVGLLLLVETREKGGILEKYYQPVARQIGVASRLLQTAPSNDALITTESLLKQVEHGFLHELRSRIEQKQDMREAMLGLSFTRIYVTNEEYAQLMKQLTEAVRPYESRRGVEDEQELFCTLIIYPQTLPHPTSIESEQVQLQNAVTVGAVSYSVADLERVIAEGKRLNISVTGICHFEKNVSAELVERAVAQFSLVGKLEALPAVRTVLQQKKAPKKQ